MRTLVASLSAAMALHVLSIGDVAASPRLDLLRRGRVYDGVGGLPGGGATSNFLLSYEPAVRREIMRLLFEPGYGAGLDILKMEIGSDDETGNSHYMIAPWLASRPAGQICPAIGAI